MIFSGPPVQQQKRARFMANRREFLQGSAVLSVLAMFPARALLDASAMASPYKVLVDPRHGASVAFGAAMAERGVAVHHLNKGDVTSLWRNELAAVWRERPVALAGVTDVAPLFCLEQLGRQYGLRVVHREAQGDLVAWVLVPNAFA
jgi:uncharacterized protein YcsI (UPF0317 family)